MGPVGPDPQFCHDSDNDLDKDLNKDLENDLNLDNNLENGHINGFGTFRLFGHFSPRSSYLSQNAFENQFF